MRKQICIVLAVLGCLLAVSVYAVQKGSQQDASASEPAGGAMKQKSTALVTEMDKISYMIGTQLGQNLKKQGIEIEIEPFTWGLRDAITGKKPALSQQEMQQVSTTFQRRMMAKQQQLRKAEAAKNLAEGVKFLEANKAKEGVKVLPSGLQYKIITAGTGRSPSINDTVRVHYRGTLINGKEFDSSYKRNAPAEFRVNGVIDGWTEALQLMKEGDKWQLYIPANLAYREQGRPNIPPNSTLLFEVELLEVVK